MNVNSVVGELLCLSCLLTGGLRLLVGSGRSLRHLLNTLLGAGVNVFDRLAVLGGQVIELVGLVDERRGLLLNVVFAGAADRRRHASCQCND